MDTIFGLTILSSQAKQDQFRKETHMMDWPEPCNCGDEDCPRCYPPRWNEDDEDPDRDETTLEGDE